MGDEFKIGNHTRRFRLAVLVAVLFVLVATLLAVAALGVAPGGFSLDGGNLFDGSGTQEVDLEQGERTGTVPVDPGQVDIGSLIESGNVDVQWIIENDGRVPISEIPEGAIPEGAFEDGEVPEDGIPANASALNVPPPPYDIALQSEPVPGNEVTVTVTKDGEPVPGAVVRFNGTVVGLTDTAGEVRAPVPYVRELNVTAEPLIIVDDEQAPEDSGGGDDTLATTAGGGHAATAVAHGTQAATARPVQETNSSATFEVPADIEAVPDEPPLPGELVQVTIQREGQGIPHLEVYVQDELVGVTDENGSVELPIPPDAETGGDVRVEAERNQFAGAATLDVAELEIEIDPGLIALPGTSADVEVRAVDGEREMGVEGVQTTVTDNGVVITREQTDEDGTATVGLPWSNSVTASASAYGTTVSTTQTGMLYHLAAVLAVPLLGLIVGGVWLRRNPAVADGAKNWLINAVITLGHALRRLGRRIAAAARRVRAALARPLARLRAAVRGLGVVRSLSPLRWLLYRGRRLRAALMGLLLAPLRWLLGDSSSEGSTATTDTDTSDGTDTTAVTATDTTALGAYRRLLLAWRWLVQRVVGRSRTKTAIEVEERALEAGLPERPVRRLRRAFQDVEYGFADPEEKVETAEDAVESLQDEEEEE